MQECLSLVFTSESPSVAGRLAVMSHASRLQRLLVSALPVNMSLQHVVGITQVRSIHYIFKNVMYTL